MRFVKGAIAGGMVLVWSCTSTDNLTGGESSADGGPDVATTDAPSIVDGGTDAAPSIEAACQSFASAHCGRVTACAPAWIVQSYGGPTTCIEREKLGCTHEAMLAGARFGANLAQCADDVTKRSCTDVVNGVLPASCVVPGDLADGASCVADRQCASTFCGDQDGSHCGKCKQRPLAGEACQGTCASGLTCYSGTCMARVGVGGDCTAAPCNADLFCNATKKCEALRAFNEGCDQVTAPCNSTQDLSCTNNVCVKNVYAQPGQSCMNTNGCSGGICRPPAPPLCVAFAKIGEPCGPTPCLAPGICVAGQCVLADPSFCVK